MEDKSPEPLIEAEGHEVCPMLAAGDALFHSEIRAFDGDFAVLERVASASSAFFGSQYDVVVAPQQNNGSAAISAEDQQRARWCYTLLGDL